ncbi:MAG: 23S rRNA (pseudouridine(1915)-N(3))-methyltransferase RlmH [Prevotellaceae bacterium]|nr:23S rRNA (pseudouridine(1915)-N(3))-methyltransferase RlmH [Prevotellaceae bacterium]
MKTVLILVGKTTDKRVQSLFDDYAARLRHYGGCDVIVIPELRNTKSLTAEQQKQAEGQLILRQVQAGDCVVLLDERGTERRSMEFAEWLRRKQQTISRRLVFIVGGPYGFSADVYARADEQISLSQMTFSHQMVRLFFIEQLYRAHTIIKGEPYHHE